MRVDFRVLRWVVWEFNLSCKAEIISREVFPGVAEGVGGKGFKL